MVDLDCAGLTALSSPANNKRRQIHSLDGGATESGVKPPRYKAASSRRTPKPHSKLIKSNKLLVYPAAVGGEWTGLWPSVLQNLHLVPIVRSGQNFNA